MKLSINFFPNQRDLKTFGAALLASSILAITATANDFELKWSTEGVELSEGDKKVFFYQRATKSQDGKYPRANYLHPLYDLDGAVITDDFPKDHPHHRGIFWTWHYFHVTLGAKRAEVNLAEQRLRCWQGERLVGRKKR